MRSALGTHWPEYLMEAAGLGIFMLSAGGFGIVLFHPAITFVRLGKIAMPDAFFYVAAQLVGGVCGIVTIALVSHGLVADPAVKYVVTVPGAAAGAPIAFVAELAISLALTSVVLAVSNAPRIARYTGLCAGILLAAYITFEAPISSMSMNPARSFASALLADLWTAFWVYVTAPLIGMLLAAELRLRLSPQPVRCAKLHRDNPRRCIFRGGYA